jgi:hypothetical protein
MRMSKLSTVVLAAVLVFSAAVAQAQDEMALRFYVVNKIGDGLSPSTSFRPKYIADLGVVYSAMDYGLEDTYLVGAHVTAAQHQGLAANLDVIAIPLNLDNQIGLTALSTVQTKLEGLRVPAGWVNENHTYRDVVRIVGKIFLMMQRFHGLHHRTFFESGITLGTRMNQLTNGQETAIRNAINSLAQSFNVVIDLSGVTQTTTVRQLFKIVADQLPSFTLEGEVF